MGGRKEDEDTRVRVKITNTGKAKQGPRDWVERKGVLFPSLFHIIFFHGGRGIGFWYSAMNG